MQTASTATPSPNPTPEPTFTPEASPTSEPDSKADCALDAVPTFADYASWTKVNPQPINGHEVKVNIYVNDLAQDIYMSASGDAFPVCSKIVKTHLFDEETVTAMTVMVKMAEGYDPAHNDWWWGMYDSNGKNAMMSGRVQVCIDCHQPEAEQDYVFSAKVMAASAALEIK